MHEFHGIQEMVVPVHLSNGRITEGVPDEYTRWAEANGKNLLIDNYIVLDPVGRRLDVIADEIVDVSMQAAHARIVMLQDDVKSSGQELPELLQARGIEFYVITAAN